MNTAISIAEETKEVDNKVDTQRVANESDVNEEKKTAAEIRKALALVPKSVSKRSRTFRRKPSHGCFVPKAPHLIDPVSAKESSTSRNQDAEILDNNSRQEATHNDQTKNVPPDSSAPSKTTVTALSPMDDIISRAEVSQ